MISWSRGWAQGRRNGFRVSRHNGGADRDYRGALSAPSGLFYWLLWQRGGEKLHAKRLNRDRPMRSIVMQEIRLSLLSSVVYAVPAAIVLVALLHGGTAVYYDWRAYGGVPYLFLSFFIYLVVQDAYYYFEG